MNTQFIIVHDHGFPALYVRLVQGYMGHSAGALYFLKMLPGVWKG